MKQQQLDRVAEVEVPDLVSRQTVHIREDRNIVDEQRDGRRAERLAVGAEMVLPL